MQGCLSKSASALACAVALLAIHADAGAQLSRERPPLPTDTTHAAAHGPLLPTQSGFALSQLRHDRVLDARAATRFTIKRLFHEQGIRCPAEEIFLRIFKRERSLELWVRPAGQDSYALLKTYAICALAGELGPKRRQGDNQTPEGFYFVDFFNPKSDFLLSLHVDYPNRHDRIAGDGANLGGDIFIHGGCNSEGCLALTDDGIRELYWVAVEARAVGQERIPVHIFPARLGDADARALQKSFQSEPELVGFWNTLKPMYDFFETTRRVPAVSVDNDGAYILRGAAEPSGKKPLGAPVGGPGS
jgi:murein L,D-transpeptidase YafK